MTTATLQGDWHNQHGSVLHLEVGPGGKLSGTFRTAVGVASHDEKFPLVGFVTENRIAFCVHFGKEGSLTSWVGHWRGEGGGGEIDALWHMAVRVTDPDAARDPWRATWTGADTFRRGVPPVASKSSLLPSSPVRGGS